MGANNKLIWCIAVLAAAYTGLAWQAPAPVDSHPPKQKLSEYGFFSGRLADLNPAPRVWPYEVNAPLFSDYAEKLRFIYLPEGSKVKYQPNEAFDLPDGAVIIKNFFYPEDARRPAAGRQLLETRLLVRENGVWKALAYRWDAQQQDAELEVAGATFPVSWINQMGKKQSLDYVIPNLNQCKGCHAHDGQFVPIGITSRQLNRLESGVNQLRAWQAADILDISEGDFPAAEQALFDYRNLKNPEKAPFELVDKAARAYLDGNCAHCHNPHGPASTSGMFLEAAQTDPERLGVGKAPVAAGRGSGNRKFGIVPGKPGESILFFRMESSDPGIRMPELGRQIAHQEGLALIRQWIKSM